MGLRSFCRRLLSRLSDVFRRKTTPQTEEDVYREMAREMFPGDRDKLAREVMYRSMKNNTICFGSSDANDEVRITEYPLTEGLDPNGAIKETKN